MNVDPRFLLGALLLLVPTAAPAQTSEAPGLLPQPQRVELTAGRLPLRDGLRILVGRSASPRVQEIAGILRDELRSGAGISAQVEKSDEPPPAGSINLVLTPPPDGTPASPEGYVLEVAQSAEMRATDPRGLLWGVQTLLQGIETSSAEPPSLPRGKISDQPAYPWRAVLLDPVRSFLDLDFLRRTIRVMSAYKLNILHLHLTDDQAWRFETKAFPLCNRPGEPLYTQAELKELVAFAGRYGVEIIPEFDFPGHAMTAVNAYPDLDCEGKTRAMDEAIFCAGKPFTWEFMEKVIAEAAEIFPSEYIHLGADEPFAVKRWATCPFCQARMKAKGVATTAELYHTFVADLDDLVKRHGKKLIVWNDAITPGVAPLPPRDILLDAWVDPVHVQALAKTGYALVNSSIRPMYISSYSQRDGFPMSTLWQWTPQVFGLREARTSDSILKTVPLPEGSAIRGGQVAAWAADQRIMERRLYPRVLAVAETLWSGSNRGEYDGFLARLARGHMARLHRLGVPDDAALPADVVFGGTNLSEWVLSRATPFTLADGVLRAPGASVPDVLCTQRSYRDFILTFERQSTAATGQTGFFIRCSATLPSAPPHGFAVRSSPPAGMKIGAGDVASLKGWNRFELVARGPVVSLTINGYLAWSVTDPAPRAGPIALTGDGDGFEVRNVVVRPLDNPILP